MMDRNLRNIKNMRLLMVCTVPTDKSGIPMVILNLIEAMDMTDLEVGYVAINEPPADMRLRLEGRGVRIYVIPRKMSDPSGYIMRLKEVAKDYDVVHAHGNSATMTLEMIAANLAGVPVRAAHAHSTSCSQVLIDQVMRPLFYSLCNCRLACGKEAGRFLFRKKDFTVVNNGIDTGRYRFSDEVRTAMRRQLGIPEDAKVIGHVGNFVEAKNHDFLLDVYLEYARSHPGTRLLLLGEGPMKEKMIGKAREAGLQEKVYFMGSVSRTQDFLCAMDIVVMPSCFEGLPLTMVEEQANGLRIVASDRITRDADMTGRVRFLPLDEPPMTWARAIERELAVPDHDTETSDQCIAGIKGAGFDIKSVSGNLLRLFRDRLSSGSDS